MIHLACFGNMFCGHLPVSSYSKVRAVIHAPNGFVSWLLLLLVIVHALFEPHSRCKVRNFDDGSSVLRGQQIMAHWTWKLA